VPKLVAAVELKSVLVEEAETLDVNGSFPHTQKEIGLSKEDVLVQDLLGAAGGWTLAEGKRKGVGP
jgi:hypothetical protein